MAQLLILENEFWQLGILPQTGGSIAFGRIQHEGAWFDILRPTHETDYTSAFKCASFVMVPWCNRLKDGKFLFDGKVHQMPINHKDGTAIHGIGCDFEWTIRKQEPTRIELGLDTRKFRTRVAFPVPFTVKMDFRLAGKRLTISLDLKNVGKHPMPAGFGLHPYFQRTLVNHEDTVKVKLPYSEYFPLENTLVAGDPTPTPKNAIWDYQRLRLLDDKALDHVLTGRDEKQPIRLQYSQSKRELVIKSDPIFEHLVVYTPLRQSFFAVEPVTNVNNGFNIMHEGITRHGVFILDPMQRQKGKVIFDLK